MLVARPRNHLNLQRKGLGFRGPFALYRGSEHSSEVAPQLDAQLLPASRWGQHNSVHQTTNGFAVASVRVSGSWSALASSRTFVR
jgi:hypothetical protein